MLRGSVSPDDALDAVVGTDTRHTVAGAPDHYGEVGLILALGSLRSCGATGLALVLPVPGDVAGLPGPPEVNAEAVDAGEAVLARGLRSQAPAYALVPAVETSGSSLVQVCWQCHETLSSRVTALPSLAEADRGLKEALIEATEELARLDIARWRPDLPKTLARLREDLAEPVLPSDYPARAERVLSSARMVAAIVDLATPDPGAAVSAGSIALRGEVLTRLAAVSRHAVVAAVNAPLEPSGATVR